MISLTPYEAHKTAVTLMQLWGCDGSQKYVDPQRLGMAVAVSMYPKRLAEILHLSATLEAHVQKAIQTEGKTAKIEADHLYEALQTDDENLVTAITGLAGLKYNSNLDIYTAGSELGYIKISVSGLFDSSNVVPLKVVQ
ncbi:MAG: hypothetical protein ACSHWQ_01315 [Spongiibacteraceae bacterium]